MTSRFSEEKEGIPNTKKKNGGCLVRGCKGRQKGKACTLREQRVDLVKGRRKTQTSRARAQETEKPSAKGNPLREPVYYDHHGGEILASHGKENETMRCISSGKEGGTVFEDEEGGRKS